MAWQIIGIWAITAITLAGFAYDEIRRRRAVTGRPLRRVGGHELHVPRTLRAVMPSPAARLRRAQLRSVGF